MEENKEGMNITMNSEIQIIEDEPQVIENNIEPQVIENNIEPQTVENNVPEEESKVDEINDILGLKNKASIYIVAVIGIVAFILILICLLFAIG